MHARIRQFLILLALCAGSVLHAADRVAHLPLAADYCAILRAFTDKPDVNCPAPPDIGSTRSAARGAIPPGDPLDERGYFIRFAFDSDALTPVFQNHLQELSKVLKSDAMAELCLMLIGHTDSAGAANYNHALSVKRARSVQLYLQGVVGIASGRVGMAGRGESKPLPGLSPTDARNRRVEILAKPQEGPSCG